MTVLFWPHSAILPASYTHISGENLVEIIVLILATYFFTGFGASLGYHRLLSHRSYSAKKWFEYLLIFLGLPSGTPLQWAAQHRWHHKYSDADEDPHSPVQRGFLGAHVGWYIGTNNTWLCFCYMLAGPFRLVFDAFWRPRHWDRRWEQMIPDLLENSVLVFISRPNVYALLMLTYLAVIGAIYWFVLGAFGFVLLYFVFVILYNLGDSLSSLGHLWGNKFEGSQCQSRNLRWLAFLTGGEAWHANHHKHPNSANYCFDSNEVDLGYEILKFFKKMNVVKKLNNFVSSENFSHSSEPLHILAVGGVFGRLLSFRVFGNYMHNLESVFKKMYPQSSFEYYQPPTLLSFNATSDEIALRVRQSFFIHQRRVLLVGHSKGAVQALTSLIDHSDICVDRIVAGALLLNGPFKGSKIADYCQTILKKLNISFSALNEFTTEFMNNLWTQKLSKLKPEQADQLKRNCVFFISEIQSSSEVPWPLIPVSKYLLRTRSKSDGLLTIESQSPPFATQNILLSNRHHGYYVCGAQLSDVGLHHQVGLFTSLVKLIKKDDAKTSSVDEAHQILSAIELSQKTLRVGSFNLGLLDIPIFGVPFNTERWREIPNALRQSQCDIYFLQEIFSAEYRSQLENLFPEFQIFKGDQKNNHGLALMVRKSILEIETGDSNCFNYDSFQKQRNTETYVQFEKGYIRAEVKLRGESQPLHLVNLHLTAFASAKFIRRQQLRQIVRDVITPLSQKQKGWLIVGGDFNRPLRTPLQPQEFTFSDQSNLTNYKSRLNRDPSQTIDYILPQSLGKNQFWKAEKIHVKYAEPVVRIFGPGEKLSFVELSDHKLIFADIILHSGGAL